MEIVHCQFVRENYEACFAIANNTVLKAENCVPSFLAFLTLLLSKEEN